MKFYSQYAQDKYLYDNHLKDVKDGYFLDIGAHDGISLSNTMFFEKEMGWKGICIEPNPVVFDKIVKNRDCICLNGCIADFTGKSKFLKIEGYCEMLSGLIDEYDERHLKRIDYELQRFGGSKEIIEVDCFKIEDVLAENNISKIDFCSLDVEGIELKILQSIDFSKVSIDFFTIENAYKTVKIKRLLQSNGYKLIEVLDCDEIYKKIS